MTSTMLGEDSGLFNKYFSGDYLKLSQDKVENVKIALSSVLKSSKPYVDKLKKLQQADYHLQKSGIQEIEMMYDEDKMKKHLILPMISYDCFYLNFINQPDPTSLMYSSKKLDLGNPDLLMDKSEDAYLKKSDDSTLKSGKLKNRLRLQVLFKFILCILLVFASQGPLHNTRFISQMTY